MRRRLAACLLGAALLVLLVGLRVADPAVVRVARETVFDTFQQWKPRVAPANQPLRIITIDDAALASVGQWPWSRQTMASIADRLTELGAAAVVFDVLFSEPDRLSPSGALSNDDLLAQALAGRPTVLSMSRSEQGAPAPSPKAGYALTGSASLARLPDLTGVAAPLPIFADAAAGLGVASLDSDGASVARRLPLLWSNGSEPLPALAVETLRVALGVSTLVVQGDASGAIEGLRIGPLVVPTGPTGEMWLYYRALEPQTYISAQRLLADDYALLTPLLAGHIVLVGASAPGLLDIRTSALGSAVPGVSIHLQALEQMLTGTFLYRADWVSGLELAVIGASVLAIFAAVLLTGPMLGLVISLALAGLVAAGSWYGFARFGLLLDPSFALFSALLAYAGVSFFQFAVTDADRRRIRRAFAHYVEPSLLSQIEANAGLLRLGGDMRDLSVMFCDVRNFTALSERTRPTELVTILNRVFGALGAEITGHAGTIDKFMGDAVMAFWNAPVSVPDHAHKACAAALAMRRALAELNLRHPDDERISIGIGLSTGPALVGNMGFEKRFDYSCIGETVNVASRLESSCRRIGYDILVTEETRQAAPALAYLFAGQLVLKGLSQPEPIYLLVGDADMAAAPGFIALAAEHFALIEAWSRGEQPDGLREACRAAAGKVEPRLPAFYDAAVARPEDFQRP